MTTNDTPIEIHVPHERGHQGRKELEEQLERLRDHFATNGFAPFSIYVDEHCLVVTMLSFNPPGEFRGRYRFDYDLASVYNEGEERVEWGVALSRFLSQLKEVLDNESERLRNLSELCGLMSQSFSLNVQTAAGQSDAMNGGE